MTEAGRPFALVPAAGGGSRFGGTAPKQYADLAGWPLLARTLDRLVSALAPVTIVVLLAPDDAFYDKFNGARPDLEAVPVEAVLRLVAELSNDDVGGLLAIPLADTLKRDDGKTPARVLRTEDRAGSWQAQTPQMFRYGILRAAYALPGALAATDEAQAVEALAITGVCASPRLVTGSAQNVKVTYPADLALAAAVLELQAGP